AAIEAGDDRDVAAVLRSILPMTVRFRLVRTERVTTISCVMSNFIAFGERPPRNDQPRLGRAGVARVWIRVGGEIVRAGLHGSIGRARWTRCAANLTRAHNGHAYDSGGTKDSS